MAGPVAGQAEEQSLSEVNFTVLIWNYSQIDDAYKKNRMRAGRGNGPHPYEVGADWVKNLRSPQSASGAQWTVRWAMKKSG